MRDIAAVTIGFIGFMMIAGSGNDCDGHCVEQANTIGEMLAVAGGGFALIGIAIVIFNYKRGF